jgi:outer membrane receptor for ferrienterochelin and colicins
MKGKFRFGLLLLLACRASGYAFSQETDTIKSKQLEEVVITATRNERTVGSLPMPVTLVKQEVIKTMGSVRLTDILTEQTGLVVVPQINAQGNGIQIQGFNPDYTLILIDGEPIIGRYTGSLELSRLAVGNIKQVEIVKGPSSSLYGSDALAGVINIITERPTHNEGNLAIRYGTNNTLDINGKASFIYKKLGVYAFGNRYSTDGYDLSPQNYGQTVSPFRNTTFNTKITYQLSDKTAISLAGRMFNESQDFNFDVLTNTGMSVRTYGTGTVSDWNLNPVLTHRFTSKLKTTARFYTTQYKTVSDLKRKSDDSLTYHDDFFQTFTRAELNAEYYFSDANITTLGMGEVSESVQTSRYRDDQQRKQQTRYAFLQHEWTPLAKLTVIGGMRYDYNSIYGDQLSPKLSARFALSKRVVFKGSFGVGFKSPDFRQLYFNFTNSAAGGYSVLGTEVIKEKLSQLQAQGQIQSYVYDPALIGKLEAEHSLSFNVGARVEPVRNLFVDVNLFRNKIDNLIEDQLMAINTSGQNIYSYRNIRKAIMQGVEANVTYPVHKAISLSAGYQLLYAKDANVEEAVDRGEVYWRDPVTLVTQRLQPSEYFGLYNRSRHTGNFKVFYQNKEKGVEASMRIIYRGKFGIGDIRGNIQGEEIPTSDKNNNSILDVYDDFVPGYFLVNVSMAYRLKKNLRLQLGIDNLLNYTNPVYIPNLPGRLSYISLSYQFIQKTSTK